MSNIRGDSHVAVNSSPSAWRCLIFVRKVRRDVPSGWGWSVYSKGRSPPARLTRWVSDSTAQASRTVAGVLNSRTCDGAPPMSGG